MPCRAQDLFIHERHGKLLSVQASTLPLVLHSMRMCRDQNVPWSNRSLSIGFFSVDLAVMASFLTLLARSGAMAAEIFPTTVSIHLGQKKNISCDTSISFTLFLKQWTFLLSFVSEREEPTCNLSLLLWLVC